MESELARIRDEALAALAACRDDADIEALRVRFLGRKGELTGVLRGIGELPAEQRRVIGETANQIKALLEERIVALRTRWQEEQRARSLAAERIDITIPGHQWPHGSLHPLLQTLDDTIAIFTTMGFEVARGPDIEDDYHNFAALNIPADHPAREMQDTFFIAPEVVLRTHTSPVQIRVMESRQPPLQIIVPGAVYRCDDDVTHSPMFVQLEGLMVGKDISFAHLKGVLTAFVHTMFGPDTPVRFRPSYFPFTEPSAEVDMGCVICGGNNASCAVCKGSGWLEVLGSGMVHPNVFRAVGYDPEQVSGFAFGMGIDRIAMRRYGIDDIRLFYQNDLRFLQQF
ncbi:MAG TPA: phenylalanine--tRNA ligase subunit alpha [Candidatus Binatia bacterium]|jgi:phenylalanyl-tRNA synthetase alpha chain|nr:phenylalanine--tRNA ligase subunit alpha [Candidatus Binatia bacterium]